MFKKKKKEKRAFKEEAEGPIHSSVDAFRMADIEFNGNLIGKRKMVTFVRKIALLLYLGVAQNI